MQGASESDETDDVSASDPDAHGGPRLDELAATSEGPSTGAERGAADVADRGESTDEDEAAEPEP